MIDDFLKAMSKAANSVTVVTTEGAAGKVGVTVSAMCSVSVDDPSATILICVHKESPACAAINSNGVFCANLLCDDQSNISNCFAGRTGATGTSKFDCASWHTQATGSPVLDGALASFDCEVVHDVPVGTHHIFIGQVKHVASSDASKPLVYHDREYSMLQTLPTP